MKRFKATKIASFLGIFFNLFLFIIKFIAAFITSSQAMIADAINSLGDIFSSLMTLIGNKIASKPKDDDHNLGHGKAEYIYSLLISIVIIIVALTLFKDSFESIFNRSNYTFSYMLIIVCVITIVVKISLFIYTNKLSKSLNSLLLKANSKDHLYDAIITMINLISIFLTNIGIYFIDGVVGVLISLWILVSGIKIFKESYDVLMDKSIDDITKEKVLNVVKKYSEVKKINHFNATPVGYKYQISFTIFVDGNMSTYASHDIANKIERELEQFDEIYLTVIHVNPI